MNPTPYFSSGPCRKYHSYTNSSHPMASVHRSRQSTPFRNRIETLLNQTRNFLEIPDDYQIILTPGSDTGAIETAFWNLLGANPINAYSWSVFGEKWINDIKELEKSMDAGNKVSYYQFPFGSIPKLETPNKENDLVMVYNATTTSFLLPNLDWISDEHQGLVFVDGTSVVFSQRMEWNKIDVFSFSWQKNQGAEGGLGTLVLSPKAIERLHNYQPPWPIPFLFRLKTKDGMFNYQLGQNNTINTFSSLVIEDAIQSVEWFKNYFGNIEKVENILEENHQIISEWVENNPNLEFLIKESKYRSRTNLCVLLPNFTKEEIQNMVNSLDSQGKVYDIKSHPQAPFGLRIWTGPTITREDILYIISELNNSINELIKK